MRFIFTVFLIASVSGCAFNMPTNDRIKEISYLEIDCAKEDITVVHRRNSLTHRDWELSCKDKRYSCEMGVDNAVRCSDSE